MSEDIVGAKVTYQLHKLHREEILVHGERERRIVLEPLWSEHDYDTQEEAHVYLMSRRRTEFGGNDQIVILPVYEVEL